MPLRFAFRLFKHSSLWVYRLLTFVVLTGALLFALVVLTLRYWILPHVDDYRSHIVEGLSGAIHQRLSIGRIEGDWDGYRPRLILRDVSLLDAQGQERLKLAEVDSTLSWVSLFVGELRFNSIELEHLSLEIRRDHSGRLLVAGIPVDESGGDGGLSEWLLAQHRVVVRNSQLTWIDERLGGTPLVLRDVDVRVEQLFWTHRFGVRAKPPIEVASPIDIRGDFLGRSFRESSSWSGRLYVAIGYTDLAALRQWVELPMQTTQGSGGIRMWGELEHGQPQQLTADVALSNLHTRLSDEVPELQISKLRGRVGWRSDTRALEVWARGLTFATPDGVNLPPADISYMRTRPAANRPPAADVVFNAVELDAVVRLLDRLPVDSALRNRLGELNPRGRLRDFRVRWQEPFSWSGPYAVSGSFQDVTVNPAAQAPGMSHLSGEVEANERGGTLAVNAQAAALDMPKLLLAPVPLDTFQASASWTVRDGQPQIALERLVLSNKDLAGQLSGRYSAAADAPGTIDMTGTFARVSGPEVWRYVPITATDSLRQWLHRAFVSGNGRDVHIKLRGDLRRFPWARGGDGVFEVVGAFNDGTVAYASAWPRLEGLRGQIAVRGKRLEVTTSGGGVFGAGLSAATAVIPDLGSPDPVLEVRGELEGPTSDLMRYVHESPIEERVGDFIDGMRASGRGRLSLRVDVPLNRSLDTELSGVYVFADNTLDLGDGLPVLGQLAGKLSFTNHDVSLTDGAARVFGAPMRFSVSREDTGAVRIQAVGQVDVARLRREIDQPALGYLSGSTEWRLTATVRDRRHDYIIESNLVGVESLLPAPFAKPPLQRVPLRVERRERTRGHDLLSFSYGDIAAGQLLLDKIGKGGIWRGEIALGGSAASPQRDGIWIGGTVDRIDVDQWQELLASGSAGGRTGATAVSGINVSAQTARAFSRDFHDVRVTAVQRDGTWQCRLDARELAGDVKWLPEGDGMIVGRFTRLQLPTATAEVEPAPDPGSARQGRGKDLPSVDVTADDFRMGQRQFGKLALLAVPSGPDWRIERLEMTSPDGAFSVNGIWQAWTVNPRTQMRLKLEVNDIGRFFARMALPQGIQGGKARLEGPLAWSGPPYALDLATLSGQLALTARDGRFVKIDPGIGKLLSVISLQTLPKVVTLDLRDIFSQGFAFEDIAAKIDLARGVAHTQNFEMNGPAARVKMSGDVNLASETQQLDVHIYPSLSESVALGTALVNPAVGLGALVLQKALKDPIGQMLGFNYIVAGTWTAPTVTKKKRDRIEPEPGRR